MGTRSWFVGIVLAAGSAAPAVLAAPPQVEIRWSGAPCAERAQIQAEVERLLAHAPGSGAAHRVEARVDQRPLRRYHLVVETSEGGNHFRREIAAESCRELTKPAALIIALAIDPQATARALSETAAPARESPAPVESPRESPREPAAEASVASRPPPNEVPAAPVVDAGPRRVSPAASAGARWSPYVRPSVVFDSSVLPAPSTGPGIAIGLVRSAWRFELGAFYLPARFAESEGNPLKGGDITLVGGAASSCFAALREPIELGPCLGVEAGVLHGEGVGVSSPAEDDVGWLAARAGGRLAFVFGQNFAASLRADALARVGRGEFAIENLGPVHRPGSFGLRLDAGIELGWP